MDQPARVAGRSRSCEHSVVPIQALWARRGVPRHRVMPRIFASLAIGQVLVLLGTAAVSLATLGRGPERHIVLAVFALILSCLIQVITFTYLTVTGKMLVQAVHLAGLSPSPIQEAKKLKRTLIHYLALLIVTMVVVTATGANLWRAGAGSVWHWSAALAVIGVHAFVLHREYAVIVANASLVARTLAAYGKHRSVN